jgi:hypothetical protein
MNLATRRVAWKPCWRIVPSRYPPIDLFERIAPPEDWEALAAVESLTNPRIREEIGEIALVAPEDRITGPGASIIMAAFTHLNPAGSRFSDGSYGALYAARRIETAIAETRHHRERFLGATAEPRMELDMRAYALDLKGLLHDLRGRQAELTHVYDPSDYGASQRLARELRRAGSNGIVYDSVRHEGGQCAAGFRPRLFANARQERHLCYVWDGTRIREVYEKRALG